MTRNIFFPFFLLLLSQFFVFGQEREPMVLEPHTLGWYQQFFKENNDKPIEAQLQGGTKKLNDAIDTPDLMDDVVGLKEIGLLHLTKTNNYELAMGNFIKALAIEDSIQAELPKIYTYLSIARVFEQVGNYYRGAEFLEQALKISTIENDKELSALILNDLGKLSVLMNNTRRGFELYQRVLLMENEIDERQIAQTLYNMGQLYIQEKQYTKALEEHKKALKLIRAFRDRKLEALSLNDIGHLYWQMKNQARSLANHVAALEIRQELQDPVGTAESYNNIAAIYYYQQKYPRAIANLNIALKLGLEAQAKHKIKNSYKYLSLSNKALGQYKEALDYQDLHLAMNEFIQNEKDEHQLLEIQNRYVIDKTETQIAGLEKQREIKELELSKEKRYSSFLFILISFGLVVGMLVLYGYFIKRRSNMVLKVANKKVSDQNTELNELNATKDKFFSIISHDLKGPLNSLSSFSNLLINYTESLSPEEIKALATDLDKSIKNLFSLLENLLEWSRSQTGKIEFQPENFDLAELLEENKTLLEVQAGNKNIQLTNTNQEPIEIHANKNSINTVIRNLISNSIKFTPEGGSITLSSTIKPGSVQVSVKDTGVGMSKEVIEKLFRIDTKHSTKGTAEEKGTGLGLILCKDFVEKNGGTIWVESELEKGSTFSFSLPFPTPL